MAFSSGVKLGDLDDFISLSQESFRGLGSSSDSEKFGLFGGYKQSKHPQKAEGRVAQNIGMPAQHQDGSQECVKPLIEAWTHTL